MINLKDNVSETTRLALGLPEQISGAKLYCAIQRFKTSEDRIFPRGKWATIQHLESLVVAETVLGEDDDNS